MQDIDEEVSSSIVQTESPALMIVWGLIGATDLPGWRITAWLVAYGSIVYGLQSLLFPGQASAAPAGWAFAAVVWGTA